MRSFYFVLGGNDSLIDTDGDDCGYNRSVMNEISSMEKGEWEGDTPNWVFNTRQQAEKAAEKAAISGELGDRPMMVCKAVCVIKRHLPTPMVDRLVFTK